MIGNALALNIFLSIASCWKVIKELLSFDSSFVENFPVSMQFWHVQHNIVAISMISRHKLALFTI